MPLAKVGIVLLGYLLGSFPSVALVATLPMLAGFKHLTMLPPSAREPREGQT